MATTVLAGIKGSFVTASPVHGGSFRAWSADLIQEVNDSTGFSNVPWRTCLGGLKSLRGSASGYLQGHGASSPPNFTNITGDASTTLTLTADTGCTYSFAGVISNIRVGQGVDGNGTVSLDFVSSGAVVESTAWNT